MSPAPAPSVSVVIPTRDRPQMLERAVSSVVCQDYPGEIECLVVFDGGDAGPVVSNLPPGRSLRTLSNDRTPGLAGSRNCGALAARGELLAFLDDDDEWLPRKLGVQQELMRAERARIVGCGIFVCRGTRSTRRPAKRRVTYRDLLRARHMELNPCTLLVERSFFLHEVGLVDESLPGSYAEDYEWLLRAAPKADIVSAPEPLVRIRWHADSYFARDWSTIVAGLRSTLAKHPALATETDGLARIAGQLAFALAALGERRSARRWARTAVRANPREVRAYLAWLVSAGLVRAGSVVRTANALGRGL